MGRDAFKNKFFVLAVTISLIASIGITFVPVTAKMFGLYPLSIKEFVLSVGMGSLGLLVLPELFMRKKLWKWK